MGKTLKRQRAKQLKEQQQVQQQDGARPSKLPRLSGMPPLNSGSSSSKFTFAVSAAMQAKNWLAALQTLQAMAVYGKVPKLGAIQRWVRDADQAGSEAVTARLIDAILRCTMPPESKAVAATIQEVATAAAAQNSDLLSGSVVRHPPWSPPAAAVTEQQQQQDPPRQQQQPHYADLFYQVPFQPGAGGPDAIYAYPPNSAVQFDHNHQAAQSVAVPFVPGAQCLIGVLSKQECEQIIAAAEAIGYNANVDYTFGGAIGGGDGGAEAGGQQQQQQVSSADLAAAAKSAARGSAAELVGLQHGGPAQGCVWLVDDSVLGPIYERVQHLLPQEVDGGALAGINARWRLYRYTPGNVYRPHIDGAWPGSGVDSQGQYVFDAFGDRWSRLTFLVYLNDDFEGGHTTYYTANDDKVGVLDARGVKPRQGNVMVFPHGGTVGSLVHEGSAVLKGAKYVIRTDVLYMKTQNGGRQQQQQQQSQQLQQAKTLKR